MKLSEFIAMLQAKQKEMPGDPNVWILTPYGMYYRSIDWVYSGRDGSVQIMTDPTQEKAVV